MAQFRNTGEGSQTGGRARACPEFFVFVAPVATMDCAWPISGESNAVAAAQSATSARHDFFDCTPQGPRL